MSKKFLIILISSVLGLLLLSLVGYYFIIQNGVDSNGKPLTFRSFLPFGGDETPINPEPAEEENLTGETPKESNFNQRLRKISNEPVAGAGTFDIKAGSIVRYIEKATGHIFEVELFSPSSNRISNTTIPAVYDAVWGNKSISIVARYLKSDDRTVDTYSILIKDISTSTENTISGIPFPGGISDVSSFGVNVFYLQQSANISQGYVSNFDGSKKKLIWSSEIKELNSQFVNDKTVALNTKPYQEIPGYLYFVDTNTGQTKRVLGNILGLSSLVNSAGNKVAYIQQSSGVNFYTYDIPKGITLEISPKTFPEKCVWSKKDVNILYCAVPKTTITNTSLTEWYQGRVSFEDDIWRYNLKDNTSSLIMEPLQESGEMLDIIKPTLSENEQYLLFVNKKDNSLWSLDLSKVIEIIYH